MQQNRGDRPREEKYDVLRIQEEKRKRRRRQKRADIICLTVTVVLFSAVVLMNLLRTDRPTVSEVEKRELARFPDFSFNALVKGEYTSGINSFISDTFVFRDSLVGLSKKLDSLKGIDYTVGDGGFTVLSSGHNDQQGDSGLSELLSNLNSGNYGTQAPEPGEEDKTVLSLSKNQLSLTVGGGGLLTANIPEGMEDVQWSVDNTGVLELLPNGESAKFKALAAGEATITLSSGNASAVCTVTVSEITVHGVDNGSTADFMANGLFIYGDAVYTRPWYIPENSQNYLDTAAYYKRLFPRATVSACVAPTSAICIDNETIKSELEDQKAIFDHIASMTPDSVNYVDVYASLYAHRDEYIYFRTDHHWTQRGAYYAYKAFVESIGLDPVRLDDMTRTVLSDNYSGSMYEYTKNERVKSFSDTLEAYLNTKDVTMTVTGRDGMTQTYDSTVMEWSDTYSAFICGDNPYTVINVPDNPQDRNILVLKDSYGDALIPYLAENFGNIMVVDTRYSSMNVAEMFADYDLSDILFINNLEAANSPVWAKMYLSAVGVEVN